MSSSSPSLPADTPGAGSDALAHNFVPAATASPSPHVVDSTPAAHSQQPTPAAQRETPSSLIPPATPVTRPKTGGAGNVALAGSAVEFATFRTYVAGAKGLGGRPYQQDEFFVMQNTPYLVLGVFDGHGTDGAKVSARVRHFMTRTLRDRLVAAASEIASGESPEPPCIARTLTRLVTDAGEDLRTCGVAGDCYLSGTTALLVVISTNYVHVANLGDCAAVMLRRRRICAQRLSSDAFKLTRDHTCLDPVERSRIEYAGGRVERCQADQLADAPKLDKNKDDKGNEKAQVEEVEDIGPLRIYQGTMPYPGLVVTRSLGDDVAHKVGVLDEPEVTSYKITPDDYALVIGSDGLWDGCTAARLPGVLAISGVADALSSSSFSIQLAEKAARTLLSTALKGQRKRQMEDNISTICALFQHSSSNPSK